MNAHNLRWRQSILMFSGVLGLCAGLVGCQTLSLRPSAAPAPALKSAPDLKPPLAAPSAPAAPAAPLKPAPAEKPAATTAEPQTTPDAVDSVVDGNVWNQALENRRITLDRSAVGTPIVVSQTPRNELMLSVPTDWAFSPHSAKIGAALLPMLDALALSLSRQADVQLSIRAHTDNVGSDPQNNTLSLERARAVRDYLISRKVITPFIQAMGRGARDPLAPNDTPEGRSRNRRLEIMVSQTAQ